MAHRPEVIEIGAYYQDVSNNSLCFIPFCPVLTSNEKKDISGAIPKQYNSWEVGSFTGLTYTARPYVPFSSSSTLSINPYIYYKSPGSSRYESLCIQDLSGAGLSAGMQSTYLGACGPFCYASDISGNISIPNYVGGFRPTFFNIRVNIIYKDTIYNPLLDFSMFNNSNKCYLDTQLYAYSDPAYAQTDILNGWGKELASNFSQYDDDSGYNYLSFLNKIYIDAGSTIGINVRGYVPTVKIKSNLRIVGKNWTDFGSVTLATLGDEIDRLVSLGVSINSNGSLDGNLERISAKFTYNYALTLLQFNANFVGTFTFGVGFANASYAGFKVTATGFSSFIREYGTLFASVQKNILGINN
jgi:hypothetical protein